MLSRPTGRRNFWTDTSDLFVPEEMVVDLLSADQVFELLESGEGSVLENFGSHIDPLEEIVQLFCSSPGTLSFLGVPRRPMDNNIVEVW